MTSPQLQLQLLPQHIVQRAPDKQLARDPLGRWNFDPVPPLQLPEFHQAAATGSRLPARAPACAAPIKASERATR